MRAPLLVAISTHSTLQLFRLFTAKIDMIVFLGVVVVLWPVLLGLLHDVNAFLDYAYPEPPGRIFQHVPADDVLNASLNMADLLRHPFGDSLRARQLCSISCTAGQICCLEPAGFEHCCSAGGSSCCVAGCRAPGAACCGTHCCSPPNSACCGAGCYPIGSTCCSPLGSCGPGSSCCNGGCCNPPLSLCCGTYCCVAGSSCCGGGCCNVPKASGHAGSCYTGGNSPGCRVDR